MFQGREVGAELVLVMCVQGMLLMSTSGRLGVVLAKQGGALAKLLPIFQLGGGGILGSGTQYFSCNKAQKSSSCFWRAYVRVSGRFNSLYTGLCPFEAYSSVPARTYLMT